VCLSRRATPPHPTCRRCREQIAEYGAKQYKARRKAKRCARSSCNETTTAYLCETHANERRIRRAKNGTN